MAHYAELNSDNIVVQVFVGRDDDAIPEGFTSWEHYYSRPGFTAKQTSYNTLQGIHLKGGEPFRGNYAGIGYTYNQELDAFIPPKPDTTDEVADWVLNEETYSWEPVDV